MTLQPVQLDDLTWRDMVLAIRRRIAAASGQEWTLHSPADPGVTLLELYAWLLEQRVYWMDQVPDAFVRAALRLLGESQRGTQCASTVFTFPPGDFDVVEKRTEFSLNKNQRIVFSTVASITRIPIEQVIVHAGEVDRTADIEQKRLVPLFPFDGSHSEIKITLRVSKEFPAPAPEHPLSLFLDLRSPVGIETQWSNSAAIGVPPPADVEFLYRGVPGQPPVPIPRVIDGTAGLRRSGVVRIWIPDNWKPEDRQPGDPIDYAIWLRVEKSTFTASPLLGRIVANAAVGKHSRRVRPEPFSVTWRPLPGNKLPLSDSSDFDGYPALETSVGVCILERDEKPYRWRRARDLAFHGPADRVFTADRAGAVLRFGDGLTGRLPIPGNPVDGTKSVRMFYKSGGGEGGNLGKDQSWEAVIAEEGQPSVVIPATNIVGAAGGAEAESIQAARRRAAAALKKITRAVTAPDYEEIALTTPGIAIKRAHAAVGAHPEHPCVLLPGAVTVFVVPDAPHAIRNSSFEQTVDHAFVAAPVPDPGALTAIRTRMNRMRLITTEVFIRPARYRPVALVVGIESDTPDPGSVQERVKDHLQKFLDPLVGGDDKQGWPFGEPLRPAVLLRETQRALEESGEAVSVKITLLDTGDADDCFEVKIGEHELVVLRETTVNVTPKARNGQSQGGLR